jgi:hypothetical protein
MEKFIKVFDYVLAVKFIMHVHSLLVEREFLENNDILINSVFQQSQHQVLFKYGRFL